MVALAVQLAAASVVLPWSAASAASFDRLAAASLCHSGADLPAPHHQPICAVCPLCQAIGHAGLLLGSVPVAVPGPTVSPTRPGLPPPARAPPALRVAAAFARGPPALI